MTPTFPFIKYQYPYCGQDITSFPFIKYRYPYCGERRYDYFLGSFKMFKIVIDQTDCITQWYHEILKSESGDY